MGSEELPRGVGPREHRGLGEHVGLERRRRDGGCADQPGPCGAAGRRVDQVVPWRPSARCQLRRSMPDVATPPSTAERCARRPRSAGWMTSTSNGRWRRQASDAEIAAAVDDEAILALEQQRGSVCGEALAGPPESMRTPDGPTDDASCVVDLDVSPDGARVGRGGVTGRCGFEHGAQRPRVRARHRAV